MKQMHGRDFLLLMTRMVETKDSWEYVLERISKIFTRITFEELKCETTRARLLSGTCSDFQQLKWGEKSKRILAVWRRLTVIDRQIMPRLVEKHEENLVRSVFTRMKYLTLEAETSQTNVLARMKQRLDLIKLRSMFAFMLDSTKVSKQLKNGKLRACMAIMTRLVEKSARKCRLVTKTLKKMAYSRSRFSALAVLMESSLKNDSLSKIKITSSQLKQKEFRATRFQQTQILKLRKACYGELKKLAMRTSSLMQLSGVFSKMHLQFYCKGILTSWSKYTLVSPNSVFQTGIRAREHRRAHLQRRALTGLGAAVREAEGVKVRRIGEVLERGAAARVLRGWKNAVESAKNEKKREVLQSVFLEWRLACTLAKESRAVDEVMREEEKSSRAGGYGPEGAENQPNERKERKRNERFMMLLDMGGKGFAGANLGRGRGPLGDFERARLGEGTVFTSEAGTDDQFEEMAIKSAF